MAGDYEVMSLRRPRQRENKTDFANADAQ